MKTQTLDIGTIRLELRDGQLHIVMVKHPSAPVVIDATKLERWCRKIYRDEVVK